MLLKAPNDFVDDNTQFRGCLNSPLLSYHNLFFLETFNLFVMKYLTCAKVVTRIQDVYSGEWKETC